MTDYANAPAPRSALFDDAPTVTAVPARKTSQDYAPAVAVWPSGKVQKCNVKRALVLEPDAARQELRVRRVTVVYVATTEDAAAVLAAARGGGDGE